MTCGLNLLRSVWVLLAGVALSGCLPSARSQLDEEKEPHFLAGKSRVSSMDYKGAIEAFEKALVANPQSASAHFELGWLFDQRELDPAAAIYHYEHFLRLRTNAENAELVKQRILTCKQALAGSVTFGPVAEKYQREFEQLSQENRRLTEENKRLRDDLEKWQAYASRGQSLTNRSGLSVGLNRPAAPSSASATPNLPATGAGVAAPLSPARTHTVKAGETPSLIARRYGIKVETLMTANPRLEPRRMQVGQSLVIPGA